MSLPNRLPTSIRRCSREICTNRSACSRLARARSRSWRVMKRASSQAAMKFALATSRLLVRSSMMRPESTPPSLSDLVLAFTFCTNSSFE